MFSFGKKSDNFGFTYFCFSYLVASLHSLGINGTVRRDPSRLHLIKQVQRLLPLGASPKSIHRPFVRTQALGLVSAVEEMFKGGIGEVGLAGWGGRGE